MHNCLIYFFSVCSDIGTLKSSDRNDQDDMDHSLPINNVEGIK